MKNKHTHVEHSNVCFKCAAFCFFLFCLFLSLVLLGSLLFDSPSSISATGKVVFQFIFLWLINTHWPYGSNIIPSALYVILDSIYLHRQIYSLCYLYSIGNRFSTRILFVWTTSHRQNDEEKKNIQKYNDRIEEWHEKRSYQTRIIARIRRNVKVTPRSIRIDTKRNNFFSSPKRYRNTWLLLYAWYIYFFYSFFYCSFCICLSSECDRSLVVGFVRSFDMMTSKHKYSFKQNAHMNSLNIILNRVVFMVFAAPTTHSREKKMNNNNNNYTYESKIE